jgi:hypothetical protein
MSKICEYLAWGFFMIFAFVPDHWFREGLSVQTARILIVAVAIFLMVASIRQRMDEQ